MKLKKLLILVLVFAIQNRLCSQDLESIELSEEWLAKITDLAPARPSVTTDGSKKILIFSLYTGYDHWVIPHTEAVLKLLLSCSGAARFSTSKDISEFEADKIDQYDAIVLNNTCPEREDRDIFLDVLRKDDSMTEPERMEKAAALEANLIRFVAEGGGLMLVHGGATMQNNSEDFSFMTGGSFDFHPKQQPIQVELADPSHPLVRGFNGQGFVHTDEPYFYKNAYIDKNFRPLLYMKASELEGLEQQFEEDIRYIAWIKRFGEGRIFLLSPSHNAQSFEIPGLLQFYLDGMQYVLGDLECDDTPVGNGKN